MDKIKKVIIENFQNHLYTEIDFDEHINLITGTSNGGKTAINRAINFILHDEFDKGFITLGTDHTKVTIVFKDGTKFVRIKGGSKNIFIAHLPDKDEPVEFHNFGSKYPPEIKKLIGNADIIDDSNLGSLAYLGQFTPPCLTSLSPTELTRYVSRLIKIDVFDDVSKGMSSEANTCESKIKEDTIKLSKLNEQMEQYENLDNEIIAFNNIVDIYENCSEVESSLKSVSEFYDKALTNIRSIKRTNNELNFHQRYLDLETDYNKTNLSFQSIKTMKLSETSYLKVIANIKELETKNKKITETLSEDNLEKFDNIKSSYQQIKDIEGFLSRVISNATNISNTNNEINKNKLISNEDITILFNTINESKKSLDNMREMLTKCSNSQKSYNETKNGLNSKEEELKNLEEQKEFYINAQNMKSEICSGCGEVKTCGCAR